MGVTKYPIIDKGFTLKMLGASKDDEERGLITILDLTGMHVSAICSLSPSSMVKQGSQHVLRWIRPKTDKTLECYISKDKVELINAFLGMRRKSRQHYFNTVKEIGDRAGYDSVSPMTFRHNRCIRALTEEDHTIWEVPHIMGCTLEVAVRNYSKKKELDRIQGKQEP